ncbi:mitochondrial complex I protein Fmp36 [Paraphysoderma sedebokerense]|nr:mitochondrial complex I protein Fmp36 [Paraphysoderma sedebokerense]
MSASSLRPQALSMYRRLLKIQRTTFQGDIPVIRAARDETRKRFSEVKNETDPAKIEKNLKIAQQVANILERNIVQGVKKSENDQLYRLNLSPRHEINDNDTIKLAGKKGKKGVQNTCQSGHVAGEKSR